MPLFTKAEDTGHALCIEQFDLKSVVFKLSESFRDYCKGLYIFRLLILFFLSVMMGLGFVFNLDDAALVVFFKD